MNTSRQAASNPVLAFVNAPKISSNPRPRVSKRGVSAKLREPLASFGSAGVLRPHPRGFDSVGLIKLLPTLKRVSTMSARIVEVTIPIRIAPLILRIIRTIVRNRPKAKITIGHPTNCPPSPSSNGTADGLELVLPHTTLGVLLTNPASTRPMRAMNRPIPTEIATFRAVGMALNTAILKPVRTRIRIKIPSIRTNPIACAQVAFFAIETATKVFKPRPVARARGKLAIAPMRIVRIPATSAVPAATIMIALVLSPPPMNCPAPSVVARMSGLRATMYAIVKKVTSPPLTSWAIEEPRSEILKYESSMN